MRDSELVVISLLCIVLMVLAIGFNEIFIRLRPRVIYVYDDKPKDDIPIWNKRAKDDALRSRVPDAAPG